MDTVWISFSIDSRLEAWARVRRSVTGEISKLKHSPSRNSSVARTRASLTNIDRSKQIIQLLHPVDFPTNGRNRLSNYPEVIRTCGAVREPLLCRDAFSPNAGQGRCYRKQPCLSHRVIYHHAQRDLNTNHLLVCRGCQRTSTDVHIHELIAQRSN